MASTTMSRRRHIDANGYGLRVPGLVISPYAKQGYIDHQTLSFDAYLKFIEDDFLGGQRLDPKTDGRPIRDPMCARTHRTLGDLRRTSTSPNPHAHPYYSNRAGDSGETALSLSLLSLASFVALDAIELSHRTYDCRPLFRNSNRNGSSGDVA